MYNRCLFDHSYAYRSVVFFIDNCSRSREKILAVSGEAGCGYGPLMQIVDMEDVWPYDKYLCPCPCNVLEDTFS